MTARAGVAFCTSHRVRNRGRVPFWEIPEQDEVDRYALQWRTPCQTSGVSPQRWYASENRLNAGSLCKNLVE